MRASPQPEVLLSGGAAALWNPAGISALADGAAEIWMAHVDGPPATGLGGLAVSVTGDLPWIGRVAAAYQHLGIDDIPRTTDSPSSGGAVLNLGEDLVAVSFARRIGTAAAIGLAGRYTRAGHQERSQDRATLHAGALLDTELPLAPRFAVMLRDLPEEPAWHAGVMMQSEERPERPWTARAAYGVSNRFRGNHTEHQLSGGATWWGRVHTEVGLARAAGDGSWTPLWMLGADVGRYSLAVLWEDLPNAFGSALEYRFAIELP